MQTEKACFFCKSLTEFEARGRRVCSKCLHIVDEEKRKRYIITRDTGSAPTNDEETYWKRILQAVRSVDDTIVLDTAFKISERSLTGLELQDF